MKTRIINLASGSPSPALIPIQDIQSAANTVLSTPSVWQDGLNYGADAGYLPLRHSLAQWLTEFYHDGSIESSTDQPRKPDAERICVTGGASQNLACILQLYTDPVYTKAIFVVEPAYFLSFRVFTDAGFDGKLQGVPEDEEGVDIKILEQSLHDEAEKDFHRYDNQKVCHRTCLRRR
jgi:DNA-binding transcriptional MocR family regulator